MRPCSPNMARRSSINAATSGPGRPGIDFFPLTCDYRERTAAAGKFPGGFIKREGRPTTKETLTVAALRSADPAAVSQGLSATKCSASASCWPATSRTTPT